MDKIKAFFKNPLVKKIAWGVFGLGAVVLILGGASVIDLSEGAEWFAKIIEIIAGAFAFISERTK